MTALRMCPCGRLGLLVPIMVLGFVISVAPVAGRQDPPSDAPRSEVPATDESPETTEEAPPPAPPATDIFLLDLETEGDSWSVTKVRRVTDRNEYDNQPYFEPDGKSLLFTAAQDQQTDVFRYVIAGALSERMTETAESEYSPTPVPGWPGFSVVRVEADGAQRLWRFCASGGCSPERLFEDIQPVGYHAWISPERVAMFVLGEPHELVIADLLNQEPETVASDIGRALHRVPGREAVSFVDKSGGEIWTVSILDLASGKISKLIQTPPESEDFAWWSEREILIGHGAKLYLFHLDEFDGWRAVADLSEHGIVNITRLSPSPDGSRLALVAERPAEAIAGDSE